MIFEKFIDVDLGQVSYIVACNETKEAFIVDPRRDIYEYVSYIEKNALKLKYIFNSHTHADYIGGHLELASLYAANNIFHKNTPIKNFKIMHARDNDDFLIGNTLKVTVLETPGHTPFDICLLISENQTDKFLFTGDLLFVGDIGRPDLLGEENIELLANNSYDSANKIWNLSDDIIIFASHINGSLCGKHLSRQYFSTIGIEKKTNTSFQLCQKTKERYVSNLISQAIETPDFFKKMAGININGPKLINDILTNIKIVGFEEIKDKKDIQIIDLREPNQFHQMHIKNSINIYENSNVSFIAGSLLDSDKDIYLIGSNESDFDQYITKLLRVGFDNIKGIVNNDFSLINAKYQCMSNIISIDAITDGFTLISLDENCQVLGKSISSNITEIKRNDFSKYEKVVFTCHHGFKSSAVCSFLNKENIYYLGV